MKLPETDFARYATSGDESAFRAVVAGHLPMVLGVAQRRLGEHAHLSSDVAQAVFTRLARVAKGLPPDLTPAAWLHRQAVRLAIDTVRKETRRRSRESTAAMLNTPDSSSAAPAWEQIGPQLDEALDRLPASDRAALVLRYLEDRDFAEVGIALGTSPEAARKRIARGLEKLRVLLAQRGITSSISALAILLLENKAGAASAAQIANISRNALSAAAGFGGGVLLNLLMSHLPAAGVGVALVLLSAALLYQHQKREIEAKLAAALPAAVGNLLFSGGSRVGPGQLAAGSASAASLDDIIEALRQITLGPENRLADLRTEALLNLVRPDQNTEFFTKGTAVILQPRWKGIVGMANMLWRTRDPEALVKGMVEADNQSPEVIRARISSDGNFRLNCLETHWFANGEGRSEFGLGGFHEWLERDFEGTISWLESQRDTPLMRLTMMDSTSFYENLLRGAAGAMPASAPPSGMNRLARASQDASAFLKAVVIEKRDDSRPVAAILAEARSSWEVREFICSAAVMKPEECFEWVRSAPPDSGNRFDAALGIVAQQMRRTSEQTIGSLKPEQRVANAKFALENAGPMPKAEALQAIVESWMAKGHSHDHKDLLDWLVATAPQEETGMALETGARIRAGQRFTLHEALDFVARMPETPHRDSLFRGILLRLRDATPTDAEAFLRFAPPETVTLMKSLTGEESP